MPVIGEGGNAAWVNLVLRGIGAPTSDTNKSALGLWAASEAMPAWVNNPLGATLPYRNAKDYNGAGVKYYATASDGVAATIASLKLPPYSGIRDALRRNLALSRVYDAINDSPWCGGCDGGRYPLALWAVTYGKGQGSPEGPPRGDDPPEWDWSGKVAATADHFTDLARPLAHTARAVRDLPR